MKRMICMLLAAVLICAALLPAFAVTEIGSVSLKIAAPLTGGSFSGAVPATVSITGGEHFTVKAANWFGGADTAGPGLAPTSFEIDKHYFAEIHLAADEGYVFSESTAASLSGGSVSIGIDNIQVVYSGTELIICTEETGPAYEIWIGSTQVTESNRSDILGDGKAKYDPETVTLSLNDPAVTGRHNGAVIFSGGYSIIITGSATLEDSSADFGICAGSALTFKDADLVVSALGNGISATSVSVKNSRISAKGSGFGITSSNLSVEGDSYVKGISTGDDSAYDHAGGILAANIEVSGGTLEGVGAYHGISAYNDITYASPSHEISIPEDGGIAVIGGMRFISDKDDKIAAHAKISPKLPEVVGIKAHVTGTELSGGICMVKADSMETVFKSETAPVTMSVSCLYTEQACATKLTAEAVPGTDYFFMLTVDAYVDGETETLKWAANDVIKSGSALTADDAEVEIAEFAHSPAGGSLTVICRYRQNETVTVTYTVTDGADSTWVRDSGSDVTVTVKRDPDDSACFSHFVSVELDGSVLSAGEYDAKEGSTVVTLKAETLQKLAAGSHAVSVNFDDGKAETTVNVELPVETDIPVTGVRASGGLILIMAAFAVTVIAGLVPWKKRNRI